MTKRCNPYIPRKAKIIKVIRQTSDTSVFRLKCSLNHNPGQFVEVGLPGIGECPISSCSYSGNYIDLCIRNVGNVTKAIHRQKAGDYLWLRGPYGNGYPMEEMFGKDIVLIGGGTGVAPLRGAIEYIEKNRRKFGTSTILFGFRHYESILFRDDFSFWKKKFNFDFTLDCSTKKMVCNTGIITTLIDNSDISKDSKIMVCGPPVMIKFVMQALMDKSIDEKNVYISFERLMSCGVGKCGHCEIGGKYVCKHGPVFRYDLAKSLED